jgi:threonyl-tRNA synthetase
MDETLYKIRHSLAHVLAQAVLEIRPNAQLGFGPPVRNGFYYDFLVQDPITEKELPDLESRMRRILRTNEVFKKEDLNFEETLEKLEKMNQALKIEYAKELLQKYSSISFFSSGPFTDMCEGPHIESTDKIPENCFKLDSVAGSYWRGNSKNPMLTRIYGLCFLNAQELKEYIHNRELAKKRDHRKLGQELEIFTIQDDIGRGLPLWLPNGTVIRDELEKYAKELEFKDGYQRVVTPHIAREEVYQRSGHLPLYKESMFPEMKGEDKEVFYLKPMNCPHHHMIYMCQPRSYRDLPLRLAEYGTVYRYEKSGQLSGLLRVRGLAMNDAHIYCTMDQVESELKKVAELHRVYYDMFRLDKIWLRLSLHEQNKEKFVENEDNWRITENILRSILKDLKLEYVEEMGEAAFYGPKLDYQTENVVGREETISTIQLDFAMPARFQLEYTDKHGSKQRPIIIHRAPLGTHERFIAFLIERWGGAFPTWLAPIQVQMIPVSMEFSNQANQWKEVLRNELIRAEVNDSTDSFSKKIRLAITHKIPNIWIVGSQEVQKQSITWRRYVSEQQQLIKFEEAKNILNYMIKHRIMDNFSDIELPKVI